MTRFLATTEQSLRILAILVAGAWVYYQYFRGRTFAPRLEPSVSGTLFCHNEYDYVIATVRLKNVGLSKVRLQQLGTGLRILTCGDTKNSFMDVHWVSGGVFDIFRNHSWIEPTESIDTKVLSKLPEGRVGVRLEIRIEAPGHVWHAEDIIDVPSRQKAAKVTSFSQEA